ncbi:MAG: S-layer homology domain-containing protein [Candidatus Gracilibacteria bacterium]|nr:S-layer homology domain-containing protein [Candidatus Gracilibacteria bacterium]
MNNKTSILGVKKISSLLALISILFSITRIDLISASIIAGPDFNVKISANNDSTYTTSLTNVGVGTALSFKNVAILDNSGTTNGTYSVNFPAGFTYNSYDASQNTCGFSLISSTNSSFKYSYSNSGAICNSVIILNYTVNSSATSGLNNINLLDTTDIAHQNIIGQVSVDVKTNNFISRAQTLDLNGNGYIDAYKLNLANSNNTGTLSGLQVNGVSVGTVYSSGTSYILPFSDDIWNTGDLPQITGTFDGLTIGNNDINEEDLARPKILKINSTLLSTLGSQSLNIGTGNLLFDISENLIPSSTGSFTLLKGTGTITGTFSFLNDNLTKLYFVTSSSLSVGTYTLTATSGAKDWSSNGNIIDVSIPSLIVADSSAPTGIAIGTSTGISINDGASLTNNNYVQLTLAAIDDIGVSQMMISNVSNFSGASWETYNTSKLNWDLGTGAGTKTVYIKFKDEAGNISSTYSDSIEYGPTNNYISFNNLNSIYTNNSSIDLSGSCNYISSTGSTLGTTLSGSVNGVSIGSINCNSQIWSHTFNLADNTTNLIRLEFDNNSSINNEISIIRPIPTCSTPSNATLVPGTTYPTCDFTCNTGYTKQGGSCIAKSTAITTAISNSRTFSFTAFTLYYNSPQTKSSLPLSIANGTSTLTTTFTLASNGTDVSLSNSSEAISCNSGYHVSGTSCAINQSSGGGGGGGSITPTCTDTMLQCSLYNNSYIWTRKSGVSCTGGNLGLSCIPASQTGTTNTGTTTTQTGTTNTSTGNTNQGGGTNTGTTTTQVPEIIEIVKADGTKIYLNDIANHFAKNYIIALASSGIVNGYPDNTFRPDNNTSRIEFLKMLLKGLGKDYSSYAGQKNPFWDVDDNSWQSRVVAKALALGIISQNKYFNPDKTISREETMKMLIRTSGINLLSVTNSSFADSNGWAKNYIETAYKAGIISGQSIGGKLIFRPTDNITRAEVAKIIVKSIELLNSGLTNQTNTSTTNTIINKVKDAYTLTKELKFGDYGDEVGYLQDIMKHFNYFDYDSTKYFGNITKTAYINFAKDKLGIISDGTMLKSDISKIMELNW